MRRTIMVTGGTGFVGINFIRYAYSKGYRVIIIDTSDRFQRLTSMNIFPDPRLIFFPLNLAKDKIVLDEDTDAVIHLAALPHVDYSRYYPERVMKNNIFALLRTLEFAREKQIPLLFVSSIEIYGENEGELLREDDTYRPLSPYATSKVSGEMLLQSYLNTPGMLGSIARLTNLYGPWQTPDRIIPRLITQILSDYPCEVDRGRLRDFLYVEDAVQALFTIVEQKLWGEVFNISSELGYDNYHLMSLLQDISEKSINASYVTAKHRDGRGKTLISSSQKLQNVARWKPTTSLQEGLRLTYNWYASHRGWWQQFNENIRSNRESPLFLTDYTHDLWTSFAYPTREANRVYDGNAVLMPI